MITIMLVRGIIGDVHDRPVPIQVQGAVQNQLFVPILEFPP
jgi:hypothetical protein